MAEAAFTLGELADRVDGTVRGDRARVIRGIATLGAAAPDQLSFLTNIKYRDAALATRAGALLVAPGSGLERPDLLESPQPYLALAQLLRLFHPEPSREPGVSEHAWVGRDVALGRDVAVGPFAVIGDRASLGDGVVVGAGCVVGRDCRIGPGTELKPRVVLYPGTRVGADCLIHAGAVLGGDGFGFATHAGRHHKVPQLGHVVLEDEVEIGANTTIDRGTLGETRVGAGSKIDNLVMLAHGVTLGRGCLLAAQAGIAGSTRVGDHAVFAGQSGAAGHLEIAAGTVVAAKSAVLSDVAEGGFVAGIPAFEHRRWKRAQAAMKKLPEMRAELLRLRERIETLEQRRDASHEED